MIADEPQEWTPLGHPNYRLHADFTDEEIAILAVRHQQPQPFQDYHWWFPRVDAFHIFEECERLGF
jgi:hypothetical protein